MAAVLHNPLVEDEAVTSEAESHTQTMTSSSAISEKYACFHLRNCFVFRYREHTCGWMSVTAKSTTTIALGVLTYVLWTKLEALEYDRITQTDYSANNFISWVGFIGATLLWVVFGLFCWINACTRDGCTLVFAYIFLVLALVVHVVELAWTYIEDSLESDVHCWEHRMAASSFFTEYFREHEFDPVNDSFIAKYVKLCGSTATDEVNLTSDIAACFSEECLWADDPMCLLLGVSTGVLFDVVVMTGIWILSCCQSDRKIKPCCDACHCIAHACGKCCGRPRTAERVPVPFCGPCNCAHCCNGAVRKLCKLYEPIPDDPPDPLTEMAQGRAPEAA
jgi:hypothetical protein